MVNERQEMLEKSATLDFGPWYRKSPYFEATREAGCTSYDIYNHMYLPAYYDDPITEYWALLNDVTIWDVAVERTVQISGPDAVQFASRRQITLIFRNLHGLARRVHLFDRDLRLTAGDINESQEEDDCNGGAAGNQRLCFGSPGGVDRYGLIHPGGACFLARKREVRAHAR